MPEFDALGRDVAAAADSTFEAAVAGAVKAVWATAGFDQGENPNHLWTVSADIQSDRFTISAAVKDGNVYVPPAYPSTPATVDELARQDAVAAEEATTGPIPDAPEAPAAEPAVAAPVEAENAANSDVAVSDVTASVDVQVSPEPTATEPDASAA